MSWKTKDWFTFQEIKLRISNKIQLVPCYILQSHDVYCEFCCCINNSSLARQLTGEIDAFPQSEGNRQFHFNRITCVIVIWMFPGMKLTRHFQGPVLQCCHIFWTRWQLHIYTKHLHHSLANSQKFFCPCQWAGNVWSVPKLYVVANREDYLGVQSKPQLIRNRHSNEWLGKSHRTVLVLQKLTAFWSRYI